MPNDLFAQYGGQSLSSSATSPAVSTEDPFAAYGGSKLTATPSTTPKAAPDPFAAYGGASLSSHPLSEQGVDPNAGWIDQTKQKFKNAWNENNNPDQPGDTAVQKLWHTAESIPGKLWNVANVPLIDSDQINRWTGWQPTGFGKGFEDLVTGLSSPLSLGLAIGTFGSGSLVESGGAAALRAAGMSAEEISGVTKGSEILSKALQNGMREPEALGELTKAGIDANKVMEGLRTLDRSGITRDSLMKTGVIRRSGAAMLRAAGVNPASAEFAGRVAQATTEGIFTYQNLVGAAIASPRFLDAVKEGDWDTAKRLSVDILGQGAFGVLGGHALFHESGSLMDAAKVKAGLQVIPNEEYHALKAQFEPYQQDIAVASETEKQWEQAIRKKFPKMSSAGMQLARMYRETGYSEAELGRWYNAIAEAAGREDRVPIPVSGLPAMTAAEARPITPKGNPEIVAGADGYNETRGLPPVTRIAVDTDPRGKAIADAYEAMPHDPKNPLVKASYDALKRDIKNQWDYATKQLGIKFEGTTADPYANSAEMRADVQNKSLKFFKGGQMPADHPLAQVDPETGLTYNDMFRAIHDLFEHAAEGFEFGPRGEENAWNVHRQMFGRDAIPALTTETKGQNSWVNFGKHLRDSKGNIPAKGENGFVGPKERPYAQQKAGLLPRRFWYRPEDSPESSLRAVHYSDVPELNNIEPRKSAMGGEETKRMSEPGFLPRSYFGIEGEYDEARIIGRKHKYSAILNQNHYYNIAEDPEGIYAKAYQKGGQTAAENAIKDAGFSGYYRRAGQGGKSGVVVSFDDVPVNRQLPAMAAVPHMTSKANVLKYLTPKEIEQANQPRAKESLWDVAQKLPPVREFAEAAKVGSIGGKWYQRSQAAFMAMHELSPEYFKLGDADRFAGVVAATSPQQPVSTNLREALTFWKEWNDSGRPLNESEIHKAQVNGGISLLANNVTKIPNVIRALNGEETLAGRPDRYMKVTNFARNLSGMMNNVTNDTWMGIFSGVEGRIDKTSVYNAISAHVRAAADEIGVQPAEAQAAIWVFTKTLAEMAGWKGTEGSERFKPAELLEHLTPEKMQAYSRDFADIMYNDSEVRARLSDLKVNLNELDKKLESIPRPSPEGTAKAANPYLRRAAERIGRAQQSLQGFGGYSPVPTESTEFKFGALASATAPTWYLKSERILNESGIMNSASGQQWLKTLENKGVKPDEMKWIGLDDFLKENKKVSRDEVLNFIRENNVQIADVELGGITEREKARLGQLDQQIRQGVPLARNQQEEYNALTNRENLPNTTKLAAKYDRPELKLPGEHTNYREMLLTLPESARPPAYDFPNYHDYGVARGLSEQEVKDTWQTNSPYFREWKEKGDKLWREATEQRDFRGGHYGDVAPNVLAHVRFDDRIDSEGKRVLMVEEVQRDHTRLLQNHIDSNFGNIVDKMKEAGELEVECS